MLLDVKLLAIVWCKWLVTYFKNDELQFRDVIGMHPVFGGLAHKVLLTTSGGTVPFGWISSRSYIIVKF